MSNEDDIQLVPDTEAIEKYWKVKPKSFSASIMESLRTKGDAADEILGLNLTPAAKIAIARTVISAGDQKIQELEALLSQMKHERDQSFARSVWLVANRPFFRPGTYKEEAAPTTTVETDAERLKRLDKEESEFLLRYLTLRNILLFLVSAATLIGGFFAFSVNIMEKRNTQLQDINNGLVTQQTRLQDQIRRFQGDCVPQLQASNSIRASVLRRQRQHERNNKRQCFNRK
jgi:hypothetical protein